MKRMQNRHLFTLRSQFQPSSQIRCFSSCQARPSGQTPHSLPQLHEMKDRPAKFIPDYLAPMQSHLLTTTLSDLLQTNATPLSSPQIQSPPQTLPQGHHLVYFPIQTAPSHLAPDGADLDHSPGPEFPRRMWAGGEILFHPGWKDKLVMDGRPWACREEIGDVNVRGAEGQEKVFVDVWRRYGAGHEAATSREWDIEERRTLVFMRNEEAATSPPPRRATKFPHKPTASHTILPTPTHLFYFSALSFNAHSIHLDPLYARSTDGHRDLLVHGPLTLSLMLRALGGSVAQITYRNYAPLYVNEKMTICLRQPEDAKGTWDVWVEGPEGGLAVKGTATMEA